MRRRPPPHLLRASLPARAPSRGCRSVPGRGRRAGAARHPGEGRSGRGLPLPADSYDLVIMNQLIEHVAIAARPALHGDVRDLRPGGHLFLETPNLDSLDARAFRRRYWGGYHLPRHFHLFDSRTLPRAGRARRPRDGRGAAARLPAVLDHLAAELALRAPAPRVRQALGQPLQPPLAGALHGVRGAARAALVDVEPAAGGPPPGSAA